MTEDLLKKDKKPYVESTDADGKSDAEASLEAWNKHIYRNESVICNLGAKTIHTRAGVVCFEIL